MHKFALFSGRCILPGAVTRLQKSVCMMTGVVVAVGSVYGGMELFHWMKSNQADTFVTESSVTESSAKRTYRTVADKAETFVISVSQRHPIFSAVLTASMGIYLAHFQFILTKEFIKEIRHQTKCCNIIRSTAIYTVSTPVIVYAIIISSMLSCLSLRYMKN